MTLLEALSTTIRRLHYSPRTEEAYLHWVREFVRFHQRRHPREMGAPEITAFLNDLATRRRASASTQNQALCALVFLYRKVLEIEMPALDGLDRARRPDHLPSVLSRREVQVLLEHLDGPFRLLGELLYGSGLRLQEALSLRVKDIDLDRHQITVRRGKGAHDRAALLPTRTREGLITQLDLVRRRHAAELDAGRGEVDLPFALREKMPYAATSLAWQYVFPASRPCRDPASGRQVLHHLHESGHASNPAQRRVRVQRGLTAFFSEGAAGRACARRGTRRGPGATARRSDLPGLSRRLGRSRSCEPS